MDKELNSPEYYCRVCGLKYSEPTWFDQETPSHEICVCCGVQFGYEDTNLAGVQAYRNNWINNGARWFSAHHRFKMENWDLESQLLQIPEKWG